MLSLSLSFFPFSPPIRGRHDLMMDTQPLHRLAGAAGEGGGNDGSGIERGGRDGLVMLG